MKAIVILAVILVILGAGIWGYIMRESMRDQGCWVACAYGNDEDSNIEMHVMIEMGMVVRDRPRLDDKGEPLWNEWISDHFDLRDASDEAVPFTRIGWSSLIDDEKSFAVPEFYAKYTLQKGSKYTFDFVPSVRVEKQRHYRYCFTAPGEPKKMHREVFEFVRK